MPTIGTVSWGEPLNIIKMSFQSLTTNNSRMVNYAKFYFVVILYNFATKD